MVWIGYYYYSQYGRFVDWWCSLWEKLPYPSLADTFTTRHRFWLKNFRGRNSFYYQEISCSAHCWFVNSRVTKSNDTSCFFHFFFFRGFFLLRFFCFFLFLDRQLNLSNRLNFRNTIYFQHIWQNVFFVCFFFRNFRGKD